MSRCLWGEHWATNYMYLGSLSMSTMTVFTLLEPFGLPFGLPLVPGCQGFRLLFFTVSSLLVRLMASVSIITKMYFLQYFNYICKVKAKSFNDPEFTKQVQRVRTQRLSKSLVNLVDLKVKGIITEREYKLLKRKLLGF